jgi:hypothetical protein
MTEAGHLLTIYCIVALIQLNVSSQLPPVYQTWPNY